MALSSILVPGELFLIHFQRYVLTGSSDDIDSESEHRDFDATESQDSDGYMTDGAK